MLGLNGNITSKRVGLIYVTEDGIEDYLSFYIKKLLGVADRLYVLSQTSISDVNKIVDKGIEYISNDSFNNSMSAYIQVLLGDYIELYDDYEEIIFTTDRVFGPLYDLNSYFEMIPSDVCIWNFSDIHNILADDFFVMNIKQVRDGDFEYIFKKLSEYMLCQGVTEELGEIFQLLLKEKGYSCYSIFDIESLYDTGEDKLFYLYDLIVKQQYPFIPIDVFGLDKSDFLEFNNGDEITKIVNYIKLSKRYDENLIIRYLLKQENIADLKQIFNWTYILPNESDFDILDNGSYKVAVVAHLYYVEMFELCMDYLAKVPYGIDIIITTNSDDKKQNIIEVASEKGVKLTEVIVAENRGRELAALLVGCGKFLLKYKYFCFVHDKKSSAKEHLSVGLAFRDILWDSSLYSEGYIRNIIDLFEQNECMGLAVPPTVYCGSYFYPFPDYWVGNYEKTIELSKILNINVDIAEDRPIPCTGSVFWCRTEALKKLLEYDFSYNFFPKEPMDANLTTSHAIERIFPYVACDAGYYTSTIIPIEIASIEMENMRYMLGKSTNLLRGHLWNNGKSFKSMISTYSNQCIANELLKTKAAVYSVQNDRYQEDIENNLKLLKEQNYIIYMVCCNGLQEKAKSAYLKYTSNFRITTRRESIANNWIRGVEDIHKLGIDLLDSFMLISDDIVNINPVLSYEIGNTEIVLCELDNTIKMIRFSSVSLSNVDFSVFRKDNNLCVVESFINYFSKIGYYISEPANILTKLFFKSSLVKMNSYVNKNNLIIFPSLIYEWVCHNLSSEELSHKLNLEYLLEEKETNFYNYKMIVFEDREHWQYIQDLLLPIEDSGVEIEYISLKSDNHEVYQDYLHDHEKTLFEILAKEYESGHNDYIGVFDFSKCRDKSEIQYTFEELIKNIGYISAICEVFTENQAVGVVGNIYGELIFQINSNMDIYSKYGAEIQEFEKRFNFVFNRGGKHSLLNFNGFWLRRDALQMLADCDDLYVSAKKLCDAEWIVLPELLRDKGFLLATVFCKREINKVFYDSLFSYNKIISVMQNPQEIDVECIDDYIQTIKQKVVTKVEKEYEYINIPIGVKGAVKNYIHNKLGRKND